MEDSCSKLTESCRCCGMESMRLIWAFEPSCYYSFEELSGSLKTMEFVSACDYPKNFASYETLTTNYFSL